MSWTRQILLMDSRWLIHLHGSHVPNVWCASVLRLLANCRTHLKLLVIGDVNDSLGKLWSITRLQTPPSVGEKCLPVQPLIVRPLEASPTTSRCCKETWFRKLHPSSLCGSELIYWKTVLNMDTKLLAEYRGRTKPC